MIEDLFSSFFQVKQLDEATRLLAFRALADPRVPAPRDTWMLVQACARADQAIQAELADLLFRKLLATDPAQREDHPTYLGYPSAYLATAIRMLPPQAVIGHRRELEEIARDPARRLRAHPVLPQLAAFGADVVPTLLYLVEEGLALKTAGGSSKDRDREEWQSVYRSGLLGLCRIGADASAALPPLLVRLHDGTLPTDRSQRELLLKTFVRLGADPAELRSRLARDPSDEGAAEFDRHVERARTRPDCN